MRYFRPRLNVLENRTVPSTFTVTNLLDNGAGSLRQAILIANAVTGADEIDFTSGLNGTISLTSGQLDITDSVTINGPGAAKLSIDGGYANTGFSGERVFHVAALTTASISGLTITKGHPVYFGANGGGILNDGTLTVSGCTLSNNHAAAGIAGSGVGGAIANFGDLTILNSVLSGNTGGYFGGAIYHAGYGSWSSAAPPSAETCAATAAAG